MNSINHFADISRLRPTTASDVDFVHHVNPDASDQIGLYYVTHHRKSRLSSCNYAIPSAIREIPAPAYRCNIKP